VMTLWDLLPGRDRPRNARRRDRRRAPVAPASEVSVTRTAKPRPTPPNTAARLTMPERYELMTREMLRSHRVRVRKWRTSMSGVAWQVTYTDGSISRLIEAPRPRGPMSAAVFLHEIGHHAIGLGTYRPRCLEEYHAWAFALREMDRLGLNVTAGVRRRMHESLHYAVVKALRRGLKRMPPELMPFLDPPAPRPPRGLSRLSRPEYRPPRAG